MSMMMRRMMRGAQREGNEKWRQPTVPLHQTFRRLGSYAWAHKRAFIIAGFSLLFTSGLNLVVPQVTRYTIDVVIPDSNFSLLWIVVAALLGTQASLGVSGYLRTLFVSRAGQEIIHEIRSQLYRHIQSLSLRFFHNQRTGELISRVTNDVNALQRLITAGFAEVIADFVTFIIILVALFAMEWRLALAITATFPVMLAMNRFFGDRMHDAYRDVLEQNANVTSHLQETIASIQIVKSFTNEEHESQRFHEHSRASMESNINAVKVWALFSPFVEIVQSLGHATVLGYGGWMVMKGELSVGLLVAFLAYVTLLNRPIQRFVRIVNFVHMAAASAERVFEILDSIPEIRDAPDAVALPVVSGPIHFEGVSFAYENDNHVLHDFNLTIPAGSTTALVGESGAGKSTIVNLLMRFYDVDKGCISIDRHDLRKVTVETLRSRFGVVSQDIVLLNGTIRENIAYGNIGSSEEAITRAAGMAHAHDFIVEELSDGYDTQIGERGVKLSGGQRQRIAIARAILRDPEILILDEATSQLDTKAEKLIQEAIDYLVGNRTCLMIAHRLSTVMKADQVVVLEKGVIVEKGSPEMLIKSGRRFAEMCDLQKQQVG